MQILFFRLNVNFDFRNPKLRGFLWFGENVLRWTAVDSNWLRGNIYFYIPKSMFWREAPEKFQYFRSYLKAKSLCFGAKRRFVFCNFQSYFKRKITMFRRGAPENFGQISGPFHFGRSILRSVRRLVVKKISDTNATFV